MFCELPPDIFYKLIQDTNDPIKALDLINDCNKMKDFLDNMIRREDFLKHYKSMILDLEYNDLITIFNQNRQLFNIFYNDPEFWRMKILLEFRKYTDKGYHPLSSWVEKGYIIYVVKFIEFKFLSTRIDYNLTLYKASKYSHTKIVKLLLDTEYPNLSDGTKSSLVTASSHGYVDIVKLLISHRDISQRDIKKSILLAGASNHTNVLKLFLKYPDTEDEYFDFALDSALQNKNIKTVDLLVHSGRTDITKNRNAFIYVNRIDLLEIVLEDPRVVTFLVQKSRISNFLIEMVINLLKQRNVNIPINSKGEDILKLYTKHREEKFPTPDYLINEQQNLLYEYWKIMIHEKRDAYNRFYLSNYIKQFLPNRWEISLILKNGGSLDDFLEKYKMEVRGILQVQEKEMRVIFQAYPYSGVSIIHIVQKI